VIASGKLTLTALPPDFGTVAFLVFAAALATSWKVLQETGRDSILQTAER